MSKIIKMIFTVSCIFAVFAAQANPINLSVNSISYGPLKQELNGPANETIELIRTTKTPRKVTLKFKMNSVEKECNSYSILYTEVKAITKNQCDSNLDGTFECQKVTHEGFSIPRRECNDKGYVLKTNDFELTINFKSAIVLTEGSKETLKIRISQKNMKSKSLSFEGKVLSSMAKYKVKSWGNNLYFKAR